MQSDGIYLPKPPLLTMEPDCPGTAELLPMGSKERIPWFALLACIAFALPTKQSLAQPTSSHFTPLTLSPVPLRETERLCRAELPAGVKPRQSLSNAACAGP